MSLNMKLLFDECVPRPLRKEFIGHEVSTIEEAGYKSLKNGALAASQEFEVLITVDKNLVYQQNPQKLSMAVLVLDVRANKLERFLPLMSKALDALMTISPGEIVTIEV